MIAAVLGGFLSLVNYRARQDLNLEVRMIATALRDAGERSITQEDGKFWGVRFSFAARNYVLFSGDSLCVFGAEAKTYSLKGNLEFIDPSAGVKDVCFQKRSGFSSEAVNILVTIGLAGNPETATTITVYPNGRID